MSQAALPGVELALEDGSPPIGLVPKSRSLKSKLFGSRFTGLRLFVVILHFFSALGFLLFWAAHRLYEDYQFRAAAYPPKPKIGMTIPSDSALLADIVSQWPPGLTGESTLPLSRSGCLCMCKPPRGDSQALTGPLTQRSNRWVPQRNRHVESMLRTRMAGCD